MKRFKIYNVIKNVDESTKIILQPEPNYVGQAKDQI